MARAIMAALLLVAGAVPAWAGDREECHNARALLPVPDQGAAACRRLADRGDAEGQNRLGLLYSNALDYAEAMSWFRRAADQGLAIAQLNVGLSYSEGEGVPKDKAEAARWYRKAAEQGFALAQGELGRMYYLGWGLPQDYVKSYVWLSLAGSGWGPGAQYLEAVAAKMTPAQIAEAKVLATAWKPTTGQ
jgi:TPR repeat protein